MTSRFIDHIRKGDHASRPAANAVAQGTLYSCTDHGLIYQSDMSTWATYAVLAGGGAPASHAASHETGGGDPIDYYPAGDDRGEADWVARTLRGLVDDGACSPGEPPPSPGMGNTLIYESGGP